MEWVARFPYFRMHDFLMAWSRVFLLDQSLRWGNMAFNRIRWINITHHLIKLLALNLRLRWLPIHLIFTLAPLNHNPVKLFFNTRAFEFKSRSLICKRGSWLAMSVRQTLERNLFQSTRQLFHISVDIGTVNSRRRHNWLTVFFGPADFRSSRHKRCWNTLGQTRHSCPGLYCANWCFERRVLVPWFFYDVRWNRWLTFEEVFARGETTATSRVAIYSLNLSHFGRGSGLRGRCLDFWAHD